jgi:exopolyphosphatase/guanosine-5'-triphosphate,3'-diphosphate pyrophosphatase
VRPALDDPEFRAQALALRLAVLFSHGRRPLNMPAFKLASGHKVRLGLPAEWLDAHPQTAFLLEQEGEAWQQIGEEWKLSTA